MVPFFSDWERKVLGLADSLGLTKLPPAEREALGLRFLAEAEKRLGIAILPHLSAVDAARFSELLSFETTPETWQAFWKKAVPTLAPLEDGVLRDLEADFRHALK